MLDEASQLADSYEKGRSELLNLAGLGLMVEIVAHELNRATRYASASPCRSAAPAGTGQ